MVIDGKIWINNQDIYNNIDVNMLVKNVGMVFQKPNPFPMSIYDNIAYGPRIHGIKSKFADEIVERSPKQAAIWDECKDRLKRALLSMSGGQQQRLCIARALAVEPKIPLWMSRLQRLTLFQHLRLKIWHPLKKGLYYHYRYAQYAAGNENCR